MRAQAAAGAVALVAVVALTGCVAQPPPGPTAAEVADYNDQMERATWINTGLSEIFSRPEVAQGEALGSADWYNGVVACLAETSPPGTNTGDFGVGYSAGLGYTLYDAAGSIPSDAAVQLAFYSCATAHPLNAVRDLGLLSTAQLNYIYDYLAEWLVPCVQNAGYPVEEAPTRAEFIANYGQWSPYGDIPRTSGGHEVEDLLAQCGAERPPLS